MDDIETIREAVNAHVAAFGAHDVSAYFDSYADDARFVFHNNDHIVSGLDAYKTLWQQWEADDFRVERAQSFEQQIRLVGRDAAVVTHRVRIKVNDADDEQRERETLVLERRPDGQWLIVHEHYSPDHDDAPEPTR